VIKVNTPTHLSATLDFASGAVGTVVTSFDVWGHGLPGMEIYGSEGSLRLPDPNGFRGPVLLRRPGDKDWSEVPLVPEPPVNARGIGVADMVQGILEGRPHRASGDLAFHVLEIMDGILESSGSGRHIEPTSRPERPEPLTLE
jgi:predicted dehydrogenase